MKVNKYLKLMKKAEKATTRKAAKKILKKVQKLETSNQAG